MLVQSQTESFFCHSIRQCAVADFNNVHIGTQAKEREIEEVRADARTLANFCENLNDREKQLKGALEIAQVVS